MATQITWAFMDRGGEKGYAGCKVAGDVALAAVQTFVSVLDDYSEGLPDNASAAAKFEYNPDPLLTPGDQPSNFSGTVLLENTTTLKVHPITIPAIGAQYVQIQSGEESLTPAVEAAVLAAFNTMSGETCKVKKSFIQKRD